MANRFGEYDFSRTILACAGMGAMIGMILGGTTVGFPIAIASTVVGGLCGGTWGRYLK